MALFLARGFEQSLEHPNGAGEMEWRHRGCTPLEDQMTWVAVKVTLDNDMDIQTHIYLCSWYTVIRYRHQRTDAWTMQIDIVEWYGPCQLWADRPPGKKEVSRIQLKRNRSSSGTRKGCEGCQWNSQLLSFTGSFLNRIEPKKPDETRWNDIFLTFSDGILIVWGTEPERTGHHDEGQLGQSEGFLGRNRGVRHQSVHMPFPKTSVRLPVHWCQVFE